MLPGEGIKAREEPSASGRRAEPGDAPLPGPPSESETAVPDTRPRQPRPRTPASGSNPLGKHPGKHSFDSPGARSCQLPPLCQGGGTQGSSPRPRGTSRQGRRRERGGGLHGLRSRRMSTSSSSSHLRRVWELPSDQPGARTGGFGCLTSPEAEDPLVPSLCSRTRGEDTGPATSSPSFSLPARSAPRAEQLPAPAPPAVLRADPLPTGTARAPSPRELPASRILGRDPAPEPSRYTGPRADGRQRAAGLMLPRQAEAERTRGAAGFYTGSRPVLWSAARQSSWSDTICHPGPARRCLPYPSQDGNPARARPGRTARVSQGQTGSTPRSGGEAGSATVCHRSLRHFDLERGEGEGGRLQTPWSLATDGVSLPCCLSAHPIAHLPGLSRGLARNCPPLWQARAAAPPRAGRNRNPGSS